MTDEKSGNFIEKQSAKFRL